ncbi:MAG: hypothetical protein D3909_14100, partial [Candidatus Electrothrix sp. ATG1]|nr:hypothetical protein [Candidatus Electrothrix sp. ATG1]
LTRRTLVKTPVPNWSTAGNWSFNQGAPGETTVVNRIPRSYDNVYIPDGLTTYPTISGTASARELTIADGASLNMTAGTLTVGWSWEDNGGFNATGGTVVFAGPIGVKVTSSSAFQNVQIGTGSDTSIVTLEGNLDIDGNLHIQAGARFDAGAYSINLAGNWTEDDATGFIASGTSTVIFDGTNQTVNKVTNISLLNEDFSEGDGQPCCNSIYLPTSWTAEEDIAWYGGELFSDGDAFSSGNGWLHSPAVWLNSGITYTITFDFDQFQGSDTLRVYYGSAASSSSMTNSIGTVTATGSPEFTFSVPSSGTYYIGFHHDGASSSYMDNVQLTGMSGLNFYNLHVSSGTVTLNAATVIDNNLQTDNGGTVDCLTNSVTVEGTVTNNGAIKQTKTVASSTTTALGTIKNAAGTNSKYYGLEITPSSGSMGETTVEIKGNQTCSGSGIPAAGVKRCYTVTPASSQTADIKFYYRSAESNSNTTPDVYLQTGGSWTAQATSVHGGSNEAIWATGSGLTNYGTFSLSSGEPSGSTGFLPAIFLLL